MTANPSRTLHLLLEFELPLLGALVFLGVLSERFLPLAALAGLVFLCLRWIGSRLAVRDKPSDPPHAPRSTPHAPQRTPLDLPILLLALTLPLTAWATALPEITTPQIWRLLGGMALYYAVVHWAITPRRLAWAFPAAGLLGLALSAFALVSVQWSASKLPFLPEALYARLAPRLADTVHPNVMAGALALLLALTLAGWLYGLPQPARMGALVSANGRAYAGWLLLSLGGLAMAAVLLLTKSRGGWLAGGVALIVLLGLRGRFGWLALAAAGLGGAFAVYRLGLTALLEAAAANDAIGGLAGRVEIWSRALYMLQDFPFTGVGLGSFNPVADLLYPFFLFSPDTIPHSHNLFLQVAVDLGLPGLAAWLAIYLLVALTGWRVYRAGKRMGGKRAGREPLAMALGAGTLALQAALGVHGLLDAVTWGMVRTAPLVWALWGLSMAAGQVYLTGNTGSTENTENTENMKTLKH